MTHALGRVLPSTDPTRGTTAAAYDLAGNLTAYTYTYDPAGRIVTMPDGATLAYDDAGQVTSKTSGPDPVDLAGAVTTFGYDGRGNRTTSQNELGVRELAYNLADQLVGVTDPDGTSYGYTYTADGLRASTSTRTEPEAEPTVEDFVWDTLPTVPTLLQDANHLYVYGPASAPVAQIDRTTGVAEFLHGDTIGSVRTVTDAIGAVTAEGDYSAFGEMIVRGMAPVRARAILVRRHVCGGGPLETVLAHCMTLPRWRTAHE